MCSDILHVNGINGADGSYLFPSRPLEEVAKMVRLDDDETYLAQQYAMQAEQKRGEDLGLPVGVDETDVTQAGWGIVFHIDEVPEVRAALQELVQHRLDHVGKKKTHVLEYHPGDTKRAWLRRNRVTAGSVLPDRVPYYLLLVGEPTRIPYTFQHLLGTEYAVGRVSFDTPQEYQRYARSLIAYETTQELEQGRRTVFFATRHDEATRNSADQLVAPLSGAGAEQQAEGAGGAAGEMGFESEQFIGDQATKDTLVDLFNRGGADKTPALLFSATHGLGWPKNDPDQNIKQGALLCQGWDGVGAPPPEFIFGGDDLPVDARIHGLVSFMFACYSAGTPQRDNNVHYPGAQPPVIAKNPFIAHLPKRLLTHPAGGALAVIGHVDRGWSYSFLPRDTEPQILPFENMVKRILLGQPVGHALLDIRSRFKALSTEISELLRLAGFGAELQPAELVHPWIERNDARNYAVIGDPAARLRVELME